MRQGMAQFWDARAREDAFFFVDNRLDYGRPDAERFWAGGPVDVDLLLGALGVELSPGDDVVEIGCGVGRLTRVLSERVSTVRALDVSQEMLALARDHNRHLDNVRWLHGDGITLAGIDSASADACVSHVVFQHIPDPRITLGYVREIGRVLRPGGWAAFQISNDPRVHEHRRRIAIPMRARRPRGQRDPRWLGSMVELAELEHAAADGSMMIERVVGEGTQFCCVLARAG